ncbi:hypothetical protein EKH57_11460 [Halorubrum sp. BOL3-1]|uniref:hypothetical protein n=1 Tax=Halorubrum sp. BOL3-1 TaxID=2497325 RepID=UPI001004DC12|nr:hypothetical protein [Halorubrum sp. BOL3-1]QAU14389.1 hypothetical protein EKH57_11460 [Halorubrum sp. BOL3-1]
MAVFVALFLAVAGVAGTLTATADSPEIAFENPEVDVAQGDTVQIDGEAYTVGVSETEEGGGGHGGAATTVISGTLEREFTAETSETRTNGSTVSVDDREWRVEIAGEDPAEFTLVEVLDRQAILEADDSADNQTVTSDDGKEFVLVTDESGETTSVPADEYFPEPEERSHAAGETFEYGGNTVTVGNVTADGAVLVWETTQTETIEVEHHSTVTVGDTEYVAHFPDASTLQMTTDIEAYESQVTEIDRFNQYSSGLSRVLILSVLSSIMLAGMAFIPSRY